MIGAMELISETAVFTYWTVRGKLARLVQDNRRAIVHQSAADVNKGSLLNAMFVLDCIV